jgi:hypothetical protein
MMERTGVSFQRIELPDGRLRNDVVPECGTYSARIDEQACQSSSVISCKSIVISPRGAGCHIKLTVAPQRVAFLNLQEQGCI